ncbi:MaoC family dehydratase [Massilia sp. CCM 8733]|uniref:MaoC family dehydratase n=1 Tax=Massilia mucilaginosa TaxID=2609282 RepID=A0ABX0P2X9_9BURK|nr:MaoC family dehydratase [Massilia mucilaginosa]NHZ93434.1 MaoC family dehydratase [Massilia mucilaginosa]
MTRSIKEVAPNVFRASYGRYYEEFEVGHLYQHRPGRSITETDNTWFSLLTMNTHPLHFDNEYGKGTEFGRTLVASGFTVSVLGGMSVADVSQKAIANLGWTDIKLPAPLFVGDTLYAESEVLSKRLSNSRKNAGIVEVKTSGMNQHGTVVCEYKRTVLVPMRGHAVEDRIDY